MQLPSSKNKSSADRVLITPEPLSSPRICKGCGISRPLETFRKHNRGGYRWTCHPCENRWVRTTKPWDTEAKKAYQRTRRLTARGFSLTSDAKQRAKKKGIPFNLNWVRIQERIDRGFCEVTGLPFDLNTPHSWAAPSIDQIKPNEGYTEENVRIILYSLNTMLGNWGEDIVLTVSEALRQGRASCI